MLINFQKQVNSKMQERWQLFNATDFQSLMYPCFTLCRIVGTFPYNVTNSIFEISKPLYILSIIITCALCVGHLKILHRFKVFKIFTKFEDITASLEVDTYCILAGFIAIVTLILSRLRMRLLQTVMQISSRLSPESYQKLSRLIHSKDIFGSFCLMCAYFRFHSNLGTNSLDMIVFLYTDLLLFTMDMLYINCVCILKACYKDINNSLLHIQEFIINKELSVTISHYEQNNSLLIMKIKSLQKQYLIINETVHKLNIIFSLQLLATIVVGFIEIVFGLYYYFNVIQWYDKVKNSNKQVTNMFLLDATYHITKSMFIVWACETGKNQDQKIRTTIHDVLNSSRDEQIKNELQLFSLQILHGGNTFSTKAFNVDATFLTAMVGTITTHMLIVLQFLKISQSCDERSAINIS
ncbi:PREDICTED: uncharacterized protein LOC105568944 isoform X1 [Vollenhovia emeryi]|uniref:uncharacterized protein LOC105568944 isoform X1 n=1 Tax=Vollenhovia emeryi TaxID=411798 RepID=UPI0005F57F22|nr:PREDICTED: uncharacterized protein LOC105568944 isoform X1 [Vollenhovia emeryi]